MFIVPRIVVEGKVADIGADPLSTTKLLSKGLVFFDVIQICAKFGREPSKARVVIFVPRKRVELHSSDCVNVYRRFSA